MTTTTTDTMRYKFLAHAQRDAGLNLAEAEVVADFFTAVGDDMLGKLTPVLLGYKQRIAARVREQVVDEILNRLNTIGNFSFSKRMVLAIVETYREDEDLKQELD
jgi:hypothetical protein